MGWRVSDSIAPLASGAGNSLLRKLPGTQPIDIAQGGIFFAKIP
jgi:hypothetical protein